MRFSASNVMSGFKKFWILEHFTFRVFGLGVLNLNNVPYIIGLLWGSNEIISVKCLSDNTLYIGRWQ